MSADAVMPISVVLERRASQNKWLDYVWQPIGVLPRAALATGALMAEGDGFVHYHGGALDLELFRGETEGYLNNLSQTPPVVYVVLRRNEDEGELEFTPFLVTVCPYEAMGYTENNDEAVLESVPMTPEIQAFVGEFVAAHHVDEPFIKRKNKRHQDRDRRPPIARESGVS